MTSKVDYNLSKTEFKIFNDISGLQPILEISGKHGLQPNIF